MDTVRIAALIVLLAMGSICAKGLAKEPLPGAALFGGETVPRFHIQIAPEQFEQLRRTNRTYVRATVTAGTNTLRDVGVRLKGHGSFRPLEDRPSLTLKFDEFTPGQKLDGLSKIMLNNASQDTSLLSEFIAAGMFRDAGVPAARVSHARVQFNERDLGFYVLEEGMNKIFLRQHFEDPGGNLYDANARDLDQGMTQIGGKPGDQSDLAALVAAARLSAAQRATVLPQILDIDGFLSFLAVSIVGAHHDSYPLNRNNYRLYHDPTSKRFVMMPHGIDGSFSRIAMSIQLPPKYVLTRAIVETPAFEIKYRERVATLFTNSFRLDEMINRIHAAARLLQRAASNEVERAGIQARAEAFARRVVERHQNVAGQLAGIEVEPLALAPGATFKLTNWISEVDRGAASFGQGEFEGIRAFRIATGVGDNLGSWRKRMSLSPGSYRFQANVLVKAPMVGSGDASTGAAIRVSGRTVRPRVPPGRNWAAFDFVFVVRAGEEEVQLVCECRGSNVQAWFDLDSLVLRRE